MRIVLMCMSARKHNHAHELAAKKHQSSLAAIWRITGLGHGCRRRLTKGQSSSFTLSHQILMASMWQPFRLVHHIEQQGKLC
jgi:hypothetical protein